MLLLKWQQSSNLVAFCMIRDERAERLQLCGFVPNLSATYLRSIRLYIIQL